MGLSKVKKNAKAGGLLLPPAVGYSFNVLAHLYKNNKISLHYYPRMLAIGLVNLINKPFRAYERYFINPKFKMLNLKRNQFLSLGIGEAGRLFFTIFYVATLMWDI